MSDITEEMLDEFRSRYASDREARVLSAAMAKTDMADLDNFDSAKAIAESIGIHVEKSWGLGRIAGDVSVRTYRPLPDHHKPPPEEGCHGAARARPGRSGPLCTQEGNAGGNLQSPVHRLR